METIEYRTIDKSTWGAGPWQDEPDKVQFPDPDTGLPCLMVRNPRSGNWCGYVGVAEGHPAYAKKYCDVDVEVHGGLTFSAPCRPGSSESRDICHVLAPGEPDHVWWLGFDCAHWDDYMPAYSEKFRDFDEAGAGEYRDAEYVRAELRDLARQVHELRGGKE